MFLEPKLDKLLRKKVAQNRHVRCDDTSVVVSVTDRTERDLIKRVDDIDIDWSLVEKHFVKCGELFRSGKKLRVNLSFNYTESSQSSAGTQRRGNKRGSSATQRMLAELDTATQPDAEQNGSCHVMRRVSNSRAGSQREPTLKNLANLYEGTMLLAPEIDVQVTKGRAPFEPYDEQSEWNYQQRQLAERAEAYVSFPRRNENGFPVSFGLVAIGRFKIQRQKWVVDGNLELIIDETDFGHLVSKIETRKSIKSLKEGVKLEKEIQSGDYHVRGSIWVDVSEQRRDSRKAKGVFSVKEIWMLPTLNRISISAVVIVTSSKGGCHSGQAETAGRWGLFRKIVLDE